MIRSWVYMGLGECIWVSPESFSDLGFDLLRWLYIYVTCNIVE